MSPLLHLPLDIILSLADHLLTHDLSTWTRTCRTLHTALRHPLTHRIDTENLANHVLASGIFYHDLPTIRLGLWHGASSHSSRPSRCSINEAVVMGYMDTVELLTGHFGLHVGEKCIVSPLFSAIWGNELAIAEVLLRAGTDARNAPKGNFDTPLSYVARFGTVEMAGLLLRYGAVLRGGEELELCMREALAVAEANGNMEMVEIFSSW